MVSLGTYLRSDREEWMAARQKAFQKNPWFTPEFIQLACTTIFDNYLQKDKLEEWINFYHLDDNVRPKNVGVVMAGNIPMAGFHDFLTIFISGHRQTIKLSAKDNILLKHLVEKLYELEPECASSVMFADVLKGCDAYIASGSNNTARYFDFYFGRYPSIIRKNRTSVAILDGSEDGEALTLLANDVHQYFGLGCRNVTQVFVPRDYDFVPLLTAFKKYAYFSDHPKYKNNYDYYLALQIMNNLFYMTNGSILLVESSQPFAPISQLHYCYYTGKELLNEQLVNDSAIQCIVSADNVPFGQAQKPSLHTYADGIDTMQFLLSL